LRDRPRTKKKRQTTEGGQPELRKKQKVSMGKRGPDVGKGSNMERLGLRVAFICKKAKKYVLEKEKKRIQLPVVASLNLKKASWAWVVRGRGVGKGAKTTRERRSGGLATERMLRTTN